MNGKTILITGASGNVGRHLALHFAAVGARLILSGRNEDRLRETAESIGESCLLAHVADLTQRATLESLAIQAKDVVPELDVLINNAADVTSKPFEETSLEEIESIIGTNITGTLQLTRLLLPSLKRGGGGTIVNVSSLAGYKANPTQTVYSISKGATNVMSEALHAELSGSGIRVLNAALSSIATDGRPGPGQVPVEEFARQLERAIAAGQGELFLSAKSKWLMRIYSAFPGLKRMR
jgi:short-subunit dehydrogenase